jgi:hypothetical protein
MFYAIRKVYAIDSNREQFEALAFSTAADRDRFIAGKRRHYSVKRSQLSYFIRHNQPSLSKGHRYFLDEFQGDPDYAIIGIINRGVPYDGSLVY